MKPALLQFAIGLIVLHLLSHDGSVHAQAALYPPPSVSTHDRSTLIADPQILSKDAREAPELDSQDQRDLRALVRRLISFEERPNLSPERAKGTDHQGKRNGNGLGDGTKSEPSDEGFRWSSAVKQSLMFLGIQHGYALTQPKTRESIKGKFWKDYVSSVSSLSGWADGGRFFTNYIAHPMEGSFLGYIQIQNDPKGIKQEFGKSGTYWRSRLKAMAWSAAWSTQFEIGPISQASIGNVGLKGKQTYVDIVVTPTIGTAWLVAEDALDRFVMKRIERNTSNLYVTIFARMLLSPTRTMANIFRFKKPWQRDRPRSRSCC